MTPSSDIEQYRAGFEAWLGLGDRIGPQAMWDGEGYDENTVNQMFEAWIASKREASIEPSAIRDAALEEAAQIAAWFGPSRPIVSKSPGALIQGRWEGEQGASENIAAEIRRRKSAGALTDEAKDGVRLDFIAENRRAIRHITNGTRNLFLWDANFPTEGAGLRANFRESLDSTIATSTSKGEGK